MNDNTGLCFGSTLTSCNTNQAYYWSKGWQEEESAARADITAARTVVLEGPQISLHFDTLMKPKKRQHR